MILVHMAVASGPEYSRINRSTYPQDRVRLCATSEKHVREFGLHARYPQIYGQSQESTGMPDRTASGSAAPGKNRAAIRNNLILFRE